MSNIVETNSKEAAWSHNNEDFNHDSLGDLLDNHGDDLKPGDTVYVGDAERPTMGELCSADDVIETMADRANDIAGEYAEDFPDVTKEAKDELNALLVAWMEKHCNVNFYTVTNVKPYVLTAADFETVPAAPESTSPTEGALIE